MSITTEKPLMLWKPEMTLLVIRLKDGSRNLSRIHHLLLLQQTTITHGITLISSSLTATDHESGVAETYYKINNGTVKTISTDGQPCITTEDANNTLEYWSIDNAGNEQRPHKILTGIKLDKTAPVIGHPSRLPDDEVQPYQEVKISVNVTDFVSSVKNVILSHKLDDGTWTDLFMTLNSTTGFYEATIQGQQANTLVKYKIAAYDNAGNYKVEDNGGQYYVYTVIREFPSALIMVLIVLLSFALILTKKKFQSI